jgi:hypothetical protein
LGEGMENTRRKVLILKTYKAYHAYGEMLVYYAMMNLIDYRRSNPDAAFAVMCKQLGGKRESEWVNLGGQIMRQKDLNTLRSDIGTGKLATWKDIHGRYDKHWAKYKLDKQKHAFAVLCEISGVETLTQANWNLALDKALAIQQYVSDQVYLTRKKDYDNPFRRSTFRNDAEMTAAIGTIDDNSFIVEVKRETEVLRNFIRELKKEN